VSPIFGGGGFVQLLGQNVGIEQLVPGTVLSGFSSFTKCFVGSTDSDSLTSNASVLSLTADLNNTSGGKGDEAGWIRAKIPIVGTTTSGNAGMSVVFGLYPKDTDDNTYGDNQWTAGTQGAGGFAGGYQFGSIPVAQGLSGTIYGFTKVYGIPLGLFRFIVWNNTNVAFGTGTDIRFQALTRGTF